MTVLVISHPADLHARRVMEALAKLDKPAFLLDLAELPDRATLNIDYANVADPVATWSPIGAAPIVLTEASAVWWRRPQFPSLNGIRDGAALGFAHGEWHELLYGVYQLLDCPWMNPPYSDDRASRKALQLRTASRLGLRVPETLMTSDATAARGFIARHGFGRAVYKIFAATQNVWRETRLIQPADLGALDSLHLAPVIFQEYIPAVVDVRVTIVGRRVYTMAINLQNTSYKVDFRVSLGEAGTYATVLPSEIESKLLQMMDEFDLTYGTFDLRVTDQGEYVFLEINPAGEFLFCEAGAGLPITDSLASWLAMPAAG